MHFFDTLLPVPEQAIEVPKILLDDWWNSWWKCRRSYPFLPRTMEQHVDIPFPRRGGRNAGLQGFLPGQSSTASQLSPESISERIAEQIVDFLVGGGLQDSRPGQSSSSSWHARDQEGLDEPGEGFFLAVCPNLKKVRSWVPTRVRGCPPVSAHPRWRLSSRRRPCRTPTSGCSSLMAARPITGTDAPMRLSGSRLLASTWFFGSGRWTRMGSPTTGTVIRVSVGMAFLLYLLGDGQRGEGLGIPSPLSGCHHVTAIMQPKFQQSFLFMFWRATVDTCPASALGCFWTFFLRVCGTRLLKSILSCSLVWRAALVVDLGYGTCLLVLLTSPCVPFDFAGLRTVKSHRRCFGCCICLDLEITFMSPLFLAVTCSPSGHCAEEFLGVLDDEEFSVVEGSGWRRRREFDSQVTCHPN